jgi:hypothetical protein
MVRHPRLHSRQFLFSRTEWDSLPDWKETPFSDYFLYSHPLLEVNKVTKDHIELLLIGYFFDSRTPEKSNIGILNDLSTYVHLNDLLHHLDELSGRFVLVVRSSSTFVVIPDACAQREVFYDASFIMFGSQPKLLARAIHQQEHTDPDNQAFFTSQQFRKRSDYVGDVTQYENIRRLMPNHYADLHAKKVVRYFPSADDQRDPLVGRSEVRKVAEIAVQQLKGFIRAASLRTPIEMGVTAGIDSRILFLCSLDLPCTYFVEQQQGEGAKVDIRIASELAQRYQKVLEIRPLNRECTEKDRELRNASIDFPRLKRWDTQESESLCITGNVSEVARRFFERSKPLTGANLASMY